MASEILIISTKFIERNKRKRKRSKETKPKVCKMNAHTISLRLCVYVPHACVYKDKTLLTRIVPANPLRPAVPRCGGNAQSSPTITVCKSNIIKLGYSI